MRLKSGFIKLKSKISKPCNRFISFFQAKLRNVNTTQSSSFTTLLSRLCFLSTKKEQGMSQITPRSSSSSVVDDQNLPHSRKMFTLAMSQRNNTTRTIKREEDDVKEACRRFEDYMINLITEEGKFDDVMDMEEVIYHWNNLNNPIFIKLVTRFYGELCTDLFPSDNDV
ncbi:ovate family protein 17 [Raphanus sativus]|uniref:Transcription repressor OFP17 n=1 Tax=Raphanus sativus TaxID=3726 RepID=A0A6J0NW25_RAPSA|nr:transcription repressor OFP17 [Raphanus sativus]KAJ4895392.1 ovate family protein 17 [Raphanus sativus]